MAACVQPIVSRHWCRWASACAVLAALTTFTALTTLTTLTTRTAGATPLQNAQRLYSDGDFDGALIATSVVLEKDALDTDVLLLRGRILVARADGGRAQKELRKALALGMAHERLDDVLAQALLLDGQAQRLLTELVPSPRHQGEVLAGLHVARGAAHLALGRADQAQASLALALAAVPDSTAALLAQARLDYAAGQAAAAAARVEQVLQKAPQLAEAWLFKAELLQAQGQADPALHAYAQAERLLPRSALPRLAAARILLDLGRVDEAQALLTRVLSLAPNHPAANYIQALLHFQQRHYGPAQAAVAVTLRLVPGHTPARLLLAATQLAQGAVPDARLGLLLVLRATPGDLLARKLLAAAELQLNQPERALLALAPLQSAMGARAAADADLLALIGQAHRLARDFDRAQGYLERAAALQADPTGERLRLGLKQLSRGEAARGIAGLRRAADLDPGDTRAGFVLALSHLQRGEFDAALKAARPLQDKQPHNPMAFNLVGAARAGLDDLPAARASFEQALALDAAYRPAAINLALLDLQAGRGDSARQRLQAVLAQAPGNVDAISALARLDAAPGALVERLQRARNADAQALPVRLQPAGELLARADAAGALAVAAEANAVAPDSAQTLAALGAAQEAAGRKQEAVATYEKLVRITGGAAGSAASADARYHLAGACAAAGLQTRAEQEYRRAIGLRPDHGGAMLALARLLAARGQIAAATQIAGDLRLRLPQAGSGQELLGDLLALQKRYAEAARAYDAAFAIAERGGLLVRQHAAARQAGAGGDAISLKRLQQWLTRHPDDAATRQYLADQQLAAGAVAAAVENFEKVVAADPRNALAQNNLANAWHAQGDPRALAAAEAAYQLRPAHPQIADTLGWLLIESAQSGQLARGLRLIRQAAGELEQSPDIGLHLAIALARTGDKPGARALVKRRLDMGQDIRLDPQMRALLQGA